MNINDIFSTKERVAILESVIYSNQSLGVNAIAYKLHLSKGLVSKYFDILVSRGLFEKSGSKYKVRDSLITRGIKIFFIIKNLDIRLFKKFKFIEAVGLYGSCTKGENYEDSDIDLWIKTKEAGEQELAHLTTILNKNIKNVKVLYLTDEKLGQLKDKDTLFYHSLYFGSFLIYGKKDAI